MTLAGKIYPVHTLTGRLHIKGNKGGIVTGGQTGCFTDNTPGRLFMTANTSHKLFMPDTHTHYNFVLYFFFYTQRYLFQSEFT